MSSLGIQRESHSTSHQLTAVHRQTAAVGPPPSTTGFMPPDIKRRRYAADCNTSSTSKQQIAKGGAADVMMTAVGESDRKYTASSLDGQKQVGDVLLGDKRMCHQSQSTVKTRRMVHQARLRLQQQEQQPAVPQAQLTMDVDPQVDTSDAISTISASTRASKSDSMSSSQTAGGESTYSAYTSSSFSENLRAAPTYSDSSSTISDQHAAVPSRHHQSQNSRSSKDPQQQLSQRQASSLDTTTANLQTNKPSALVDIDNDTFAFPVARAGRMSLGELDDVMMNSSDDTGGMTTASGGQDEDSFGGCDVFRCQPVYMAWRDVEQKVPPVMWMLSFDREAIERIRLSCMESVVKYVHRRQLDMTTMHLTAHFTNRLFHYYAVEVGNTMGIAPNFQSLITAAGAALRMAVKIQERLHALDPFRSRPKHLWEDMEVSHMLPNGGVGNCVKKNVELLNQMERVHIQILERESVLQLPVAPDFLDHYLKIGGWPTEVAAAYRNLALFVLCKALFLSGRLNTLRGTPPSKLAAGALVLAIKITNSNESHDAYEFWTRKLELFCQYSMTDLQPVVHSLSRMLRRCDNAGATEVLRRMFPEWASYSWC